MCGGPWKWACITGYSALTIALAMHEEGGLLACVIWAGSTGVSDACSCHADASTPLACGIKGVQAGLPVALRCRDMALVSWLAQQLENVESVRA